LDHSLHPNLQSQSTGPRSTGLGWVASLRVSQHALLDVDPTPGRPEAVAACGGQAQADARRSVFIEAPVRATSGRRADRATPVCLQPDSTLAKPNQAKETLDSKDPLPCWRTECCWTVYLTADPDPAHLWCSVWIPYRHCCRLEDTDVVARNGGHWSLLVIPKEGGLWPDLEGVCVSSGIGSPTPC